MNLCQEGAVQVEAPPTPPLALHEFLGQKAPPLMVTYRYTNDMMCPSMDGEGPIRSDECQASRQSRAATGPGQYARSSRPDSPSWRSSSPSCSRPDRPCRLPRTTEPGHEHQQHENRPVGPPGHSSQPQLPTPPEQSDWQSARKQLFDSNAKAGRAADWIRGWSMSVSEHGTETYCACGDNLTTSEAGSPSSLSPRKHPRGRIVKKLAWGIRGNGARNPLSHKQSQKAAGKGKTAVTATAPKTLAAPSPPVVCQSCGRLIAPAVQPDDWDEGIRRKPKLPGWMKDVLKRLPRHNKESRGHEENGQPETGLATGLAIPEPTNAENRVEGAEESGIRPVPGPIQREPYDGSRQRQDDDLGSNEDVLDWPSRSSEEDKRPSRAIAETQARLRRAQKLLAQSHATTGGVPGAGGR